MLLHSRPRSYHKQWDRDCVSSVLHEKYTSDSVMKVNHIWGYQKEGSYTWQKGWETTDRKGLARTALRPCKIRSAHKRRTGCVYTHVQNVLVHYHYQELLFPAEYHATITENSVPFLGIMKNNSAAAQVEGNWHFLAVPLSVTVLTIIFPLYHHGRQVTQGRSSVPEKGLQDYSLPKARWWGCPSSFYPELQSTHVSVLQNTITVAMVQWSTKAWLHWGCSSASRLTEWQVLWLQVRNLPSGFAFPFQG